jgi:hypothetical protein
MANTAKAVVAAKTARKRNRKRKRRVASSSESSSSSSEDSSSGSGDEEATTVKLKAQVLAKPVVSEDTSSSESSGSESESDSSSDNPSDEKSILHEDDVEMIDPSVPPTGRPGERGKVTYSRSPSPTPPPVPSFLPTKLDGSIDTESEQALKDRFKKFWMQSVAGAFQDDLMQIHKEPGMNKSRLAMLVDSLASGADAFTSSSPSETRDVNEMDVLMGNATC